VKAPTWVWLAIGAAVAWYFFARGGRSMGSAQLPWNRGQAGTIFQGGLYGGGQ
jgi:hypothetical protein